MTTTNFCRRLTRSDKIALNRWARQLEASEMTIHSDGSITLTCEDGIICEHYNPTTKELRR